MNRQSKLLLFTLPWVIYFVVFWLYPLAYSFYLSLTDFQLLRGFGNYIGFANYNKLLHDPVFIKSLAEYILFRIWHNSTDYHTGPNIGAFHSRKNSGPQDISGSLFHTIDYSHGRDRPDIL